MLNFELKLTANAVQLLLALEVWNQTDEYKEMVNRKKSMKQMKWVDKWAEVTKQAEYTHFLVFAKTLKREGLVSTVNDNWTVTPKGHAVINLIKIEMETMKNFQTSIQKVLVNPSKKELKK